jgi:hypothetical protein
MKEYSYNYKHKPRLLREEGRNGSTGKVTGTRVYQEFENKEPGIHGPYGKAVWR